MKCSSLINKVFSSIKVFSKPLAIIILIMAFSIFFTNWVSENKKLTEIRILYLEGNTFQGFIIGLSFLLLYIKLTRKVPQGNTKDEFEDRIYIKVIEATQGTYFFFALLLSKYSILTILNLNKYFSEKIDKSVIIALLIFCLAPIIRGLKDIVEYFKSFATKQIQENKEGEDVEAIN